ncbi:protein FAR1-RELATED SEQUENCE 2-like [Helianthus annuus]|uniref:protein FAR1-RELATED SEQUENCE 2-like n=1 Tax=Helianthus annuus TaxID=4232 RepID=UPI000B908239|nr:protein FAR1-RELATED SEQUENCE 2-like [Helianthus annuus]
MKKAISTVFVDTRHRLCMWHVMHKLSLKVGVRLCNSTNLKERIFGVVWTDILTPEEFELEWEVVIGEFNLADNDWLSDIFSLRESWIHAYYKMEELSGLMRTTSRSESENHFFSQLKSNYQVLEGQAADIYTKNIFCDVQAELIGIADCINQRYEDQPDSCLCRRFEQFGLLCRHIFYVLRSMDIREFLKQYILNRWRKEAFPNCSPEYSISHEYMIELDPDVQSMMRDIIFSTQYTLNRLSGNKEELSLYKDHVQSYMKKIQDMQIVA